jgi:hypothetical protein
MKSKLFQLYAYISTIDRRYIQLAYSVFMFAAFVICAPEDGGSGTR